MHHTALKEDYTCYSISPVTMVECTMAKSEVLPPSGNLDAVKMSSAKECLTYVQAILWSISAQTSIAHLG